MLPPSTACAIVLVSEAKSDSDELVLTLTLDGALEFELAFNGKEVAELEHCCADGAFAAAAILGSCRELLLLLLPL